VPYSGRILRITANSDILPVIERIGHNAISIDGQSYIFGASDVAVNNGDTYFILGAGAWLEKPLSGPSRLLVAEANGHVAEVFDLGLLEQEHNPDGDDRDSNATAVALAPNGTIWVSDSAGNWVARITADGSVKTVLAFPQVDSEDAVPTGIAIGPDGHAYVTLFRCQQPIAGRGGVARVASDGSFEIVASGLSNPIDVAFDNEGRMYVVEFAVDYTPGTGRVLRFNDSDAPEILIDGLTFPTSIAIAPDGSVYVTEIVSPAGGEVGSGRLLRFAPLDS
jgi:sugar lactone lactonase YvrE